MTRTRLVASSAFAVVAIIVIGSLALRPGQVPDARAAPTASGCAAQGTGAPSFCVDVGALAAAPAVARTNGLGLLDQLPACGQSSGLAPSFCIAQPLNVPDNASVAPSSSTSNGACTAVAATQAPIFCLSTLTGSAALSRDAVISYLARLSGVTTRSMDAPGVHVELDAAVSQSDEQAIRTALQRDVPAVESYLGRHFDQPQLVFVLATPAAYATTLKRLLGYASGAAGVLAMQTGGLYVPDPSVAFINWANVRGARPLVTLRHELTHALVREIVGPRATVPAWVDEGLATIVQRTALPPDGIDRSAYIALALLQTQRISLAALTPLADWSARNAELDGFAYSVAAKAIGELVRETSVPELVAILAAERDGLSFDSAYARVTGNSFARFNDSFGAKIASCGAGVATAASSSNGDVPYVVYGFAPQTELHLTIESAAYQVAFDARADEYGTYAASFGSTAPAGLYELTASAAAIAIHTLLDTRGEAGTATSPRDVCGG